MSLLISKPSGSLSPYIKQYWMIENCMRPGAIYTHRIVPCGLMELTFHLGDVPKVNNYQLSLPDNALISGQLNEYYEIDVSGHLSMFSVTFQPQGAMMFFDLPLIELFNQNIPLRFLQKELVEEVESGLFKATSFSQKIKIIEKYLIRQLHENIKEHKGQRINDSIRKISQSLGKISIGELASNACLSRKQYERIFTESIGISPKRFLKIVRFQNVIYQRQLSHKSNLTTLAYECGYFDQSHMINDFKMLSGKTPSQYFREGEAISDYFSN
ncbi:DUF6597 domain-containing transcriptional factor [Bacteroidota bacterium]